MIRSRAAVFDLDGTLVDNMRFHALAWVEIARRLGVEVSGELFERDLAGKKNGEVLRFLVQRPVEGEELARLSHEKETLYRQSYRSHLKAVPGAETFLARLKRAGTPCAVASLAPRENRDMVLDGLGLQEAFEHVVRSEEILHGKPAPDIFLAAARALQVEPGHCVAFEDAVFGVQAARSAGMEVVGLPTTLSSAQLRQAGAQWVVADFTDLPEDLLRRLIPSSQIS